MSKVKRIYPGPVNALINFIEEHFHDIDEYVIIIKTKSGDPMAYMIYDTYTPISARGLISTALETMNDTIREDEFVAKE